MKTTKRSKMLISSIAMLLVALVALGSATYAWYTVNTVVTATGAKFQASAPEGLVISRSNSTGWTNTVPVSGINNTTGLAPSSLTFDGTGVKTAVKAEAASVTQYGKNTAAATAIASGQESSYYVTDTFYIKSQATSKTVALKAACTPTAQGGTVTGTFLNYAVIDTTAGTVMGVFTSDGTSHGAITTSSTSADIATGITNATVALGYAGTNNDEFQTAGTNTVSYTADQVHTIVVVAYADGQNENCFTTQSAATNNVTFDLEFTAS